MSLAQRLWRSLPRKILRSWLIQGIGWYAMWEVMARAVLELGVVILLARLGLDFLGVVAGWLAFHTAAWFLLYGGFLKIWVLAGVRTDVGRLRRHRDRVSRMVADKPYFRAVFLRGSSGRDEMSPTSDIDLCAVSERSFGARVRAVLLWWAIRADSVLRRYPLEARWIDSERYVPYHVIEETPLIVKEPATGPRGTRAASAGTLVTLSGLDGSGKSTAVDRLVGSLRAKGLDAVSFYGHRWDGRGPSLAINFESVLRRIVGKLDRLEDARPAKVLYDTLTFVDYLRILARMSHVCRPGRVVVTDRYVADVIAFLRVRGPLLRTIEGFLVGASTEPDVAFLLEVPPEVALARKQEWKLERLEQFAREYADLKVLLSLTPVDATLPPEVLTERLEGAIGGILTLPADVRHTAVPAG